MRRKLKTDVKPLADKVGDAEVGGSARAESGRQAGDHKPRRPSRRSRLSPSRNRSRTKARAKTEEAGAEPAEKPNKPKPPNTGRTRSPNLKKDAAKEPPKRPKKPAPPAAKI